MASEASLTGTGTSDWVHAYVQCLHAIDVDVPSGVSGISYTIETTDRTTGEAKKLKKPNDVDTDWTMDESMALTVEGRRYYRLNISSFTGAGTVSIRITEVEIPN